MKFPLTFPENHMPNKQLNEKKKKSQTICYKTFSCPITAEADVCILKKLNLDKILPQFNLI